MSATFFNQHALKGNAHISNYKKALASTYNKKNIWEYLSNERKKISHKITNKFKA